MTFFNSFFRRSTIGELSGLDDNMLKDIGLHRDDIVQAAAMGKSAGGFLQQRRADRASMR